MWYARDMSIESTPLSQITDELNELEILYSRKERFKQLSPAEMREILGRLHQIQETLPDSPQQLHKVLLTAVTRLSADISNHMMDKLVDTVQQKQHSIDFLQQELSKKLREQHTASQLLNQTQQLRVKTQRLSDEFQLGSIL